MALAVALLLAGCGGDAEAPPVVYEQPSYGYLTKLRLNVAQVDIDDSWMPPAGPGPRHVESLSPVSPKAALRQMGQERVLAGGNSGRARYTIEDASIVAGPDRLDGSFAVRLDVAGAGDAPGGFAEARVVRSMTLGDSTDGGRATAYALVKQMMDDMNVEFEYQVRRSLKGALQITDPVATPAPVESQDLPASGATPPTPDAPARMPANAPTPLNP